MVRAGVPQRVGDSLGDTSVGHDRVGSVDLLADPGVDGDCWSVVGPEGGDERSERTVEVGGHQGLGRESGDDAPQVGPAGGEVGGKRAEVHRHTRRPSRLHAHANPGQGRSQVVVEVGEDPGPLDLALGDHLVVRVLGLDRELDGVGGECDCRRELPDDELLACLEALGIPRADAHRAHALLSHDEREGRPTSPLVRVVEDDLDTFGPARGRDQFVGRGEQGAGISPTGQVAGEQGEVLWRQQPGAVATCEKGAAQEHRSRRGQHQRHGRGQRTHHLGSEDPLVDREGPHDASGSNPRCQHPEQQAGVEQRLERGPRSRSQRRSGHGSRDCEQAQSRHHPEGRRRPQGPGGVGHHDGRHGPQDDPQPPPPRRTPLGRERGGGNRD